MNPNSLRDQLWDKLMKRRQHISERRGWLSGDTLGLPQFGSAETRVFRKFQQVSKTNFLPNVVSANADRLNIHSIKNLGTGRHDEETWTLWERGQVSADADQAHHNALALGWGHIQILPHPRRRDRISVKSHDPAWCIVKPYDDDSAENQAAMVISHRADKHVDVYLHVDGGTTWKWSTTKPLEEIAMFDMRAVKLVGESRTGLTRVPIIEIGDGTSVMEPGVQHQQRANQTLLHMIATERHLSFPHIVFLNVEFEKDDDGKDIVPTLPSGPDKPWMLKGENSKMTSTQAATSSDARRCYIDAIHALAAACGTPAHHVLPGEAQSTSANLVQITEQVYMARLQRLATAFGERWIAGIELMREAAGLPPQELRVVYNTSLPQPWHLAMDGFVKAVSAEYPMSDALVRSGAMSPADALRVEARMEARSGIAQLTELLSSEQSAEPDVETIVADAST